VADQPVLAAFAAESGSVPVAAWVPWVPLLIGCISRPEAEVVRPLLCALAREYPQVISVSWLHNSFVLLRMREPDSVTCVMCVTSMEYSLIF